MHVLSRFTDHAQCRFGPVYGECLHVWPCLLTVLKRECAQYMFGAVYCACSLCLLSVCLALFTACSVHVWPCLLSVVSACWALFTDRHSVHVWPCLLSVLSACLALFTESAQCIVGPVY